MHIYPFGRAGNKAGIAFSEEAKVAQQFDADGPAECR